MSTVNSLARDAITAQSITQQTTSSLWGEYELGFGCALPENTVVVDDRVERVSRRWVREHLAGAYPSAISESENWHLLFSFMPVTEEDERKFSEAMTVTDRLLKIKIRLQNILKMHHNRLSEDTYEAIPRFLDVYLDHEEWEEGDPLPKDGSFRRMLNFLTARSELRTPRFFLSRQGHCTVSWREARDKLTDLEFRPDGMIRWLVFAPPEQGSNFKERASGESAPSRVLDRMRPYGALQWMKRAA